MKELMNSFSQFGEVVWLGLRPDRRTEIRVVDRVEIDLERGVVGDHFAGISGAKRQVTLLQYEHLDVVARLLKQERIDPADLRRNIVVRGINLLALKEREFKIGGAVFYGTGDCPPCSRMEENLGVGGYNAMRGHGGITARVIEPGSVSLGSQVAVLSLD